MRRGAALLALTLLGVAPAEAGERLRTETLRLRAGSGAVDLPRIFEPMLPGSVFPDRSRPMEPVGRPVVLVLPSSGLDADAVEPFLERGFVVVRLPAGDDGTIREALDLMGPLATADLSRVALVAGGRIPLPLDRRFGRVALVRPDRSARLELPPLPVAIFVTVDGSPGPLPFDGAGEGRAIVRWYRGAEGLSPEIRRDVAEWVAATDGEAPLSSAVGALR